MVDIAFYQLLKTPLEKTLPKLLEKAYEAGFRCLVVCDSPEQRDYLNSVLWTYSPSSFLPHGIEGDPNRHPIWLALESANRNNATLIVITSGIIPNNLAEFDRCLDLFNGHDPLMTQKARERYKIYASQGHNLTFWQQTDQGTWNKAS
jgi:DNA polymerase-3 subunit chi